MRIFGKVLRVFLLVGSVLGMSTAATAGSFCTISGLSGGVYRCGFPDKESAAQWGYNITVRYRL